MGRGEPRRWDAGQGAVRAVIQGAASLGARGPGRVTHPDSGWEQAGDRD
jgi:hypothetical protein